MLREKLEKHPKGSVCAPCAARTLQRFMHFPFAAHNWMRGMEVVGTRNCFPQVKLPGNFGISAAQERDRVESARGKSEGERENRGTRSRVDSNY